MTTCCDAPQPHHPDCLCGGLGYYETDANGLPWPLCGSEICQAVPCTLSQTGMDPPAPYVDVDGDGWLDGLLRTPARWVGPRRGVGEIETLVVHCAASSNSPLRYLADPGDGRYVSAHFVIEPDGAVVQMVPLTRVAWHAGGANRHSVGVEMPGPPGRQWPEDYAHAVARIVRSVPSITRVVAHYRIHPLSRRDPGRGWPWDVLRRELPGVEVVC